MKNQKDILVIGLGRFGQSVVDKLLERGEIVDVVDVNEKVINKYADRVNAARIADTRDESTLEALGVANYDHIVVAIGQNIESSIITTLLLRDMDVTNITVKASSNRHAQALYKLGLSEHNVISPESEAGIRAAHSISCPIVADYIPLLDYKHGLVELYPGNAKLIGKTIRELDLGKRFNVNIVAVKSLDTVDIQGPDYQITGIDSLIIVGDNDAILRFEKYLMT